MSQDYLLYFIVLETMGSKNSFIKLLFFIRHILSIFIFCFLVERKSSLDNWKNISPVIQLGENNRYANENELEYRNSFPLLRSYELRKFFSYVPEVHDIAMIFLSSFPNWVISWAQNLAFTFTGYTEEK